jgi:predicted  nucleic acid-binding Zn-ribbon protein
MDTKLDKEITILELGAKLDSQEHSLKVAMAEQLKHQKRIAELSETIVALKTKIEETKTEIQKSSNN